MGNLSIMAHLHPEAPGTVAKLLIPIDATDESRWGLQYAIRRAKAGTAVEAYLLYVAEPVRNWQVLRFYTEEEIRRHFQERSAIFLEEACMPLREAGIPCQTYFREADAVQGVIDLAEELNCTAIVVPRTLWLGVFPAGLGRQLMNHRCAVPVMLTTSDGSNAS